MPSTDWKEDVAPDEATRFEQYAQLIATIQGANAKDGVVSRGLHAKQNVGIEATLEVGDVPADARHGLFATPGTYKAVVRFSNGAPKKQSDRTLDIRGIAVKVFGVDGKKVIPGLEDATTQDFLAIRTSSLPIRDAAEFMTLVKYSRPQALLPLRLAFALGPKRAIRLLKSALGGLKKPQAPLAATTYYSALPIMLGPHAVQFAFTARDTSPGGPIAGRDALGDELVARLKTTAVIYDLQVRFFTDPASTPIEDAAVEWSSPWVTVGTLTLPVQDAASARGKRVQELVEQLSFDPWHARADMRPLGNIMRARNVAYRASTQGRKALAEPREAPTFD